MATTGFSSSDDDDDTNDNGGTTHNLLPKPNIPGDKSSGKVNRKRSYNETNDTNEDENDLNVTKIRKPIQKRRKKFVGHRAFNATEELKLDNEFNWAKPPEITSVSVQGRLTIKKPLKLKDVSLVLPNCEYRPHEFVAVRCRLKNPTIMVTIFSTGMLTTQGAKSIRSGVIGIRKVAKMLKRYLTDRNDINEIINFRMWGIQGNAKINGYINLNDMAADFPNRADYNSDMSQALKYLDPIKYGNKGLCQIYDKGTITIMGCQDIKSFKSWIQDMFKIVQKYVYDKEKVMESMENTVEHFNDMNDEFNNDNNGDMDDDIIIEEEEGGGIVINDETPSWLTASNDNNEDNNDNNNGDINNDDIIIEEEEGDTIDLPPNLEFF